MAKNGHFLGVFWIFGPEKIFFIKRYFAQISLIGIEMFPPGSRRLLFLITLLTEGKLFQKWLFLAIFKNFWAKMDFFGLVGDFGT